MLWNKFHLVYREGDLLELMVKLCDAELVPNLNLYEQCLWSQLKVPSYSIKYFLIYFREEWKKIEG